MPEGNVLKLIDILNSGIYQLLSALFYNYKMFFQVGWIIYLFIFKRNILGLSKTLLSLPPPWFIRYDHADIHLGQGKDWADYGATTIKAKRESSSGSKLSSSTRAR